MKLMTFNIIKRAILLTLFASMIGCASVTMPDPSASADTLKVLRSANLSPTSVGSFSLAPNLDASLDKSIGGLRGSSVKSETGSYSGQLKKVVIAELKAAGLYDEKSQLKIESQLLDNKVDAGISVGTAKLGARFTVDKFGKREFDKVLSVDSEWESSFAGPIAIPKAINQYTSLYKLLVKKLFSDKDFQTILAR